MFVCLPRPLHRVFLAESAQNNVLCMTRGEGGKDSKRGGHARKRGGRARESGEGKCVGGEEPSKDKEKNKMYI